MGSILRFGVCIKDPDLGRFPFLLEGRGGLDGLRFKVFGAYLEVVELSWFSSGAGWSILFLRGTLHDSRGSVVRGTSSVIADLSPFTIMAPGMATEELHFFSTAIGPAVLAMRTTPKRWEHDMNLHCKQLLLLLPVLQDCFRKLHAIFRVTCSCLYCYTTRKSRPPSQKSNRACGARTWCRMLTCRVQSPKYIFGEVHKSWSLPTGSYVVALWVCSVFLLRDYNMPR